MKSGISLIGMPGAGKTTVGAGLAQKLGYEFIDLDEIMVEKTHQTLNEYLEENGEEKFLELEKQLILGLNLTNKVFSPGGSVIYEDAAMGKMKAETLVIYLNVPLYVLAARRISKTRGIVGIKKHSFAYLYKERNSLYKKYADVTVEVGEESVEEVERKILKIVTARKKMFARAS